MDEGLLRCISRWRPELWLWLILSRWRAGDREGDAKEVAEKLRDELHGKVVRNHRFPGASSVPETAESSYGHEDGEDPTNQSLAEYQYDSSLQVPADNTYRTRRTRKPVVIVDARKTRRKH